MTGDRYRERRIVNHHIQIREFVDIDGGIHYKWVLFSISGREYPIGSFDILRSENIDWKNTKKVG